MHASVPVVLITVHYGDQDDWQCPILKGESLMLSAKPVQGVNSPIHHPDLSSLVRTVDQALIS